MNICQTTIAKLQQLDLADATLVLTAEKTRYRQILTLDSDFLFYRIGDQDNFEIIQVR
ncbi:hypothetical protein PCC8801_3644 [Rippkaea orientalis PCC 8801]|uniref:DUF5615 domain-containing protein n=1 Tax=Rippkaea orientalis (strain PCC 8801 / RF-1) TaxID=41431 RepID=B7K1R4_RIPO1|nr:hypothetical protein [Rippkaea orientalis]ACK67606.1 hypothetical protein PCC8801_3644 [Rippkaea orientalis PCC 8801]